MYEKFEFQKRNKEIMGYRFPCENPKKVLCIIHGIGEYAGRYSRMAEKLEKHNIAVLSMDLRGHGLSKGTRGHAAPREEVLKDVDALIEYAEEMQSDIPIVLYGHSMGGNICLDYKARGSHNDIPCKFIVSAPWIELVRPIPAPLYKVVKTLAKIAPKMSISSACDEADLGNLEYVRPYKEDPLVHDKITLRCAVEAFDIGASLAKGLNEDNHKSDDKGFLLMHGDGDKICSIEGTRKVAKRYEGAENFTFIQWPGYYHEIHNGGSEATGDEVIEKIIDFISE